MISTHRTRVALTVALTAAVALGASGCTFITPQSTEIEYSAAEGVNVYGTGDLAVRNALIVANEDGTLGNFVAAVVNESDDAQTLDVTIGEGEEGQTFSIRVPARATVSLGSDEDDPILLEGLEVVPGADIPGYFASGGAEGVLVSLPILDGKLDYLAPLVPEED